METEERQIEVTIEGGFKEGYEQYHKDDRKTVDSITAEKWVSYGWCKFCDGGPDNVAVVGTPDNITLQVNNAVKNSSSQFK